MKKDTISDIDAIRAIQSDDGDMRVVRAFCLQCKDYFEKNRKAVLGHLDPGQKIGDDVFQNSFAALWTQIQKKQIYIEENNVWRMNSSGHCAKMTTTLSSFLMDIAENKNHEMIRMESRYVHPSQSNSRSDDDEIPEDRIAAFADTPVDPDEAEGSEQERIVAICVNELPPRCKEILTLFYIEGKSIEEICKIRGGMTYDGQKNAKSKCLKQLKEKVDNAFKSLGLKF